MEAPDQTPQTEVVKALQEVETELGTQPIAPENEAPTDEGKRDPQALSATFNSALTRAVQVNQQTPIFGKHGRIPNGISRQPEIHRSGTRASSRAGRPSGFSKPE